MEQLDLPYDAHIRSKEILVKNLKFTKTLTTSVYFLYNTCGENKGNTKSKSIYIMSNFLVIGKLDMTFKIKKIM